MQIAKVVFLDRDGVINEYPGDFLYVTEWEEFRFLPGVAQALKKLNDNGFRIFVISNQAGVSKGVYSQEALEVITRNMLDGLKKQGATIDSVYYCTHHSEANCSCRKPKTGLIEQAIERLKDEGFAIERSKTYFVGDTIRDIDTGKGAGLKTILVFSGKENPRNRIMWATIPDVVAGDLSDAVDIILKNT